MPLEVHPQLSPAGASGGLGVVGASGPSGAVGVSGAQGPAGNPNNSWREDARHPRHLPKPGAYIHLPLSQTKLPKDDNGV